jgi:hypothetical protein
MKYINSNEINATKYVHTEKTGRHSKAGRKEHIWTLTQQGYIEVSETLPEHATSARGRL